MQPTVVPTLDRSSDERWVGTYPGLGTVEVDAAGMVTVTAEPGAGPDVDEDVALRERALRHGWGDLLSFARRGYCFTWGATVARSEAEGALVISGDQSDVALLLLMLARRGWYVLADRLTPTTWHDNALLAHPREAPVIVPAGRAHKLDWSGVKVRAHTDAVTVEVPRTTHPHRVRAVALVRSRRPDEAPFEELSGHARFAAAAGLLVTVGALRPWEPSPGDEGDDGNAAVLQARAGDGLANTLRISTWPFARVAIDSKTIGDDVERLETWWQSVVGVDA